MNRICFILTEHAFGAFPYLQNIQVFILKRRYSNEHMMKVYVSNVFTVIFRSAE